MYVFEVRIQPRPGDAVAAQRVELAGIEYPALDFAPAALASAVLPRSFEQAEVALASLPRLFFEPDGSFVWVADSAESAWQVDGQLYDRDGRLVYVELKGHCPVAAFDRLLQTLGWPDAPLMFQLVREAVWLDEASFRRLAATAGRV